jgi:hypothetical protein
MVSERLQAGIIRWTGFAASGGPDEPRTRNAAGRLPVGQRRVPWTRGATSQRRDGGQESATTPVMPVVQSRSMARPAGLLRYPGTCLLSATPAPHLLYRPQPWQICRIGKVPAYGTLPRTRVRPPISGHLLPPRRPPKELDTKAQTGINSASLLCFSGHEKR